MTRSDKRAVGLIALEAADSALRDSDFPPPCSPAEVLAAATRIRNAYVHLKQQMPWPQLHPSWGSQQHHRMPPLDLEAGLRLVHEGLELVAAGRFPCLVDEREWEVEICMEGSRNHVWDAYLVGSYDPWRVLDGRQRIEAFQRVFAPFQEMLEPLDALLPTPTRHPMASLPVFWAFLAVVARPRIGYLDSVLYGDLRADDLGMWHGLNDFTFHDYDVLTLPWRCRIGPLHPDDDNDVCPDPFIELYARQLQQERPAFGRKAARVEAALGRAAATS